MVLGCNRKTQNPGMQAERVRLGTRAGSRALSPFKQAVLILRWFLDGTGVAQLAVDNAIKKSTVYDYLHEGFTEVISPS